MNSRILVVDDDEKITRMLSRGLILEGHTVEVAFDGPLALRSLAHTTYDLVILDVMIPDPNGVEICRRLRAAGDDVPIMILTARDEVEDRVLGLDAGADDYLVKPFSYEELLARVRALLRRLRQDEGILLRYSDLMLDTATWEAYRGERLLEPLSPTEFELLAFFLRHPRQVLRREQLLENVWGYDFGGNANVLELYVGYLRRKMELNGEPRLLQTIRGVGYVLREA